MTWLFIIHTIYSYYIYYILFILFFATNEAEIVINPINPQNCGALKEEEGIVSDTGVWYWAVVQNARVCCKDMGNDQKCADFPKIPAQNRDYIMRWNAMNIFLHYSPKNAQQVKQN